MYQDNLQFKKIRKHDLRRYSRKRCYLPLTRQNGEIETNGSIRDLSLSGLFLETTQIKQPGERLSVKFIIPKNPTPVEFLGEVIHVGSKEGLRVPGMGIRFIELNEVHHKILKNYILDHTFNESLRKFQREFKSTRRNVKPMNDSENIFLILSSAATIKAQIDILSPGARDLTSASLIEIHKNEISLCIPPNSIPASLKTHHHLLARLAYNGNHYFFETIITQINNDKLVATFPYSIYFEERRVEKRDSSIPEHSQTDSVEFRLSESENSYMHYKIHDSNSSGLSFICESSPAYLAPGNVLRDLRVKKKTEMVEKGDAKVIHISRKNDTHIQVGLQFLLERQSYEFYQINPVERKYTSTFNFLLNKGLSKFFSGIKNIALQISNPHFSVHLVKYLNRDAEEITAILNATVDLTKQREKVAAPVVIIPPAYARRKETTNLLALTIIESFRKQNKDIVVIRFDGIRSIGESFNDLECQHQNFQMAHYTLSQLVDDIKTTIEFTKNNIYFIPTNLIIVSFSMASVAARRAILLDKDKNITLWISCMGASDPDDLMQNSTGGIDYLKKYQNKESLSVKEVLGHLVDMDRFCNDITSNRMAYLEDSRREMAQINIPVTWIYGKYDYWINENRIKDIMSIKSSSSRRLYEVPYGHIVKNSDEAIRTFKLIAGNIWKHLHQTEIEVSTPSAWYQSAIELSEWSRLKHQKLNSQDYWRSYLLGESSE
ncbi:MAG TPA: PilZ domain-containing protein, partial [Candidatus Nitrosotenuis sp.]|nr:PilZ domain-containing protein [Candidatus Nitrosotenuis sp.]